MPKLRPMAVVTAPGKVEILEQPLPDPGPHEVQVHVGAVTLCGGDMHIFAGKHPSAPLPVPVGHEIAGQVVGVGAEVTRLNVGDRVTVEPVIVCGECYFCLRGQYHLCTSISFQYRRGQGGITNEFIVDERYAHRLPPNITYIEGAMIEPLAVAVHAVNKANFQLGHNCTIFGAGAIGLLILQMARQAGAGQTIITDVRSARLDMAHALGATITINGLERDVLEMISESTDGLGVDRAFEAVGLQLTLLQALKSLRKGGRAILVGLFEQEELSVPANIFVHREIELVGSQGYCWDFQTALQYLELGKVDLKRLVTHIFTMEQVQEAFDILADPTAGAVKVAIQMTGNA
jgi:2-desacetyl-2-hydroxyethyl bacteriochlorophyllide A dehydrogenase